MRIRIVAAFLLLGVAAPARACCGPIPPLYELWRGLVRPTIDDVCYGTPSNTRDTLVEAVCAPLGDEVRPLLDDAFPEN
jgi:hypothetical protein